MSDLAAADELLALRERLQRIRRSIEENRIKSEEPHLRRQGSMLFEDMCDWDFEQSRLPAYRRVVRQLSMLDRRLHGETKFHLMARYRLADRLYLAAPEGLVRRRDVPEGWGLIECPKGLLKKGGDQLTFDAPNPAIVRYTAPQLAASEERRMRLLRNIAVAACWAGTRKDGQLAQ